MQELIVAHMPVRERPCLATVLFQDRTPVELYIEPESSVYRVGDVYLGKIEKIDPDIPAAFVLFQPGVRGYLPLKSPSAHKGGEEIAVQIITDRQKTKLPRLSETLSLTGQYVVVSEESPGFSYSKKLDASRRLELDKAMQDLSASGLRFLFRTCAGNAIEACYAEAHSLAKTLLDIREHSLNRTCYSPLYTAPSMQEKILRNYAAAGWERLQTDDAVIAASLEEVCRSVQCPVQIYADDMLPLYHLHDLSALVDHSLHKTVPLRSGGSLVIEETEAFVCIDVNTGRATGKKASSSLKARINREAAIEAARQIRLRQLSGTILIDFINPSSEHEEKELGDLLEASFRLDPVTTRLVDFTRLHICEITRRKTYRSLRETVVRLNEP